MTNYRWNNFTGWFPEGFYRPITKRARGHQLIADLDRVLEEQSFDLGHYQELQRRLSSYFHEYKPILEDAYKGERRGLTPEEQQRVDELGRLEAEAKVELDTLLEPVANRMMKLGYSKLELIR